MSRWGLVAQYGHTWFGVLYIPDVDKEAWERTAALRPRAQALYSCFGKEDT